MNGLAYYNDNDPQCAEWLRELIAAGEIAPGDVDQRSICDVKPEDLDGYAQCHFFGGIGGWSKALRLAGIHDDFPIWTASCPCQPLSCAGKRLGEKDQRHLWPQLYRLISQRRPGTVIGEQVASGDGPEWVTGVLLDLEELGFTVAACDLPAAGVGAPHVRQRIIWVAHAENAIRREERKKHRQSSRGDGLGWISVVGGAGDAASPRCNGQGEHGSGPSSCASRPEQSGPWDDYAVIQCADGKARRVKPGLACLVDGIPLKTRPIKSRLQELGFSPKDSSRIIRQARESRIAQLHGYGNAINVHVAAAFILAAMEVI